MFKSMKHWQDPVNVVIGAWFVLSPWALGFAEHWAATASSVVVGIALAAAALGAIFVPRAWEEWLEAALGLWMVVSPWVLGFAAMQTAMLNAVIGGVVVLVLALWVLGTDKDYGGWFAKRASG